MVISGCVHDWKHRLRVLLINLRFKDGNRAEMGAFVVEFPDRIFGGFSAHFARLGVQLPHVDLRIVAARNEAAIVFEPGNSLHRFHMLFEFKVGRDHGCIKFVHPNFFVILARKKVTSMRKLNFAANFNGHGVVRLELILQNVHQFE